MPARDFRTDPFQPCPVCEALYDPDPDRACFRCDGSGRVKPFDPCAPSFRVRIYLVDAPGASPPIGARASLELLEPEVER